MSALSPVPQLIGTLSAPNSLRGTLAKNAYDPLPYEGEYEVVSKIDWDETLDTAKKYCNENNCYKIILDCEDKLIPFYERFGFKKKANSMQLYYI